ncbi:acyl carrier protein [Saccharopolyspora pogona]|uniref:acyl carrier protein n=1 Tax=Saccharopolyspora pogona TaxID=333966 RepID=UPI0016833AB5|nr:acyl carrier protein [Saccharopolyspora pogona]
MSTIEDRVIKITAEKLDVKKEHMDLTALLIDDLGADDLAMAELGEAIEGEFGIKIPYADVEQWRTVNNVVHYVHHHIR